MSPTDARILVAGAGVTGGEVLRRLTAAGRKARALVRTPARAELFRSLGVELVEGDFVRERDWVRALDGADRVFLINTAHQDAVAWHAAFLRAAQRSRVAHVVQLSGMSVTPSSAAAFHRRMGECDAALTASGLSYTILQPNTFYQNMLGMAGPIRKQGRFRSAVGGARISMIDVRDIAEVAVKALTADGHASKVYVLTGPQSLTYADVARSLSKVVGRPIEYEAVPASEAIAALVRLGVPEQLARDRVEIQLSFSNGAFTEVTNEVPRLLGRTARPFADFARDHAGAFR